MGKGTSQVTGDNQASLPYFFPSPQPDFGVCLEAFDNSIGNIITQWHGIGLSPKREENTLGIPTLEDDMGPMGRRANAMKGIAGFSGLLSKRGFSNEEKPWVSSTACCTDSSQPG